MLFYHIISFQRYVIKAKIKLITAFPLLSRSFITWRAGIFWGRRLIYGDVAGVSSRFEKLRLKSSGRGGCSNCGSGFAGFMSPHHIDLPACQHSKNCHLTESGRGRTQRWTGGCSLSSWSSWSSSWPWSWIMIMVITMRRMGLTLITIMISPMIVDPCWPKDGNEQR